MADAPTPGPTADLVTIRSGLLRATDGELESILREFFDCEPIVSEVHDVVKRRTTPLPEGLRQQMAEALLFHGFDDDASRFMQ